MGIAYIRTMCSDTHSIGVTQDRGRAINSLGATAAHELGHILNMNHDDGSKCDIFICIVERHVGLEVYCNILFKYAEIYSS